MDLERLRAGLIALQELVLDIGVPGHGQERREPVQVAHDLVGDRAGLDLPRPPHHGRHAVRSLPVRVLLVAEGGHARVGPAVPVRPVVGGVHDERVVGDAEVVEELEELADPLVVIDHRVVVLGLPAAGLPEARGLGVRPEVHAGRVEPNEEGFAGRVLPLDEVHGAGQELVVHRLHPLLGQWARVVDLLRSLPRPLDSSRRASGTWSGSSPRAGP